MKRNVREKGGLVTNTDMQTEYKLEAELQGLSRDDDVERNVYNDQKRQEMLDADSIDASEHAFMQGYENAADNDSLRGEKESSLLINREQVFGKTVPDEDVLKN